MNNQRASLHNLCHVTTHTRHCTVAVVTANEIPTTNCVFKDTSHTEHITNWCNDKKPERRGQIGGKFYIRKTIILPTKRLREKKTTTNYQKDNSQKTSSTTSVKKNSMQNKDLKSRKIERLEFKGMNKLGKNGEKKWREGKTQRRGIVTSPSPKEQTLGKK